MKTFLSLLMCVWSAGALAAWTYLEPIDEMTGRKILAASVTSSNVLNFSSPYSGDQRATLLLRNHPRRGRDAVIMIERGQFVCGIEACSVMVRFDEAKPARYTVNKSASHSTTTLFISGYERFLKGLKSSKRVRIEANVYREGAQTMDFNVGGLNWEARSSGKSAAPKITSK